MYKNCYVYPMSVQAVAKFESARACDREVRERVRVGVCMSACMCMCICACLCVSGCDYVHPPKRPIGENVLWPLAQHHMGRKAQLCPRKDCSRPTPQLRSPRNQQVRGICSGCRLEQRASEGHHLAQVVEDVDVRHVGSENVPSHPRCDQSGDICHSHRTYPAE